MERLEDSLNSGQILSERAAATKCVIKGMALPLLKTFIIEHGTMMEHVYGTNPAKGERRE